MIRLTSFLKIALVVLAVCCSCSRYSGDSSLFDVSIRESLVESGKGNVSVSVRCSGEWNLFLVDDGEEVDWALLDATSGKGSKDKIMLSYDANDSEVSRRLTVVLDDGKRLAYSNDLVQLASGQKAWLELPEINDPDLGYYSHSFEMNGSTYRNYSFAWSQKDRVAIWVAYPLCRLYTNGSVGRTNAWAQDPLLGDLSSAPFAGYGGSYARGHQLPSADRQCSYEANAQTFYGTNMTPQLNAHNEGIWAGLENKVRAIANSSDTTYVVTGVIVSASGKKERDSYGNSLTVPDAYFKVLLKYSRASTLGLGAWNAVAFYLDHRSYSENIGRQHTMSVDELEEMTGLNFFAYLPFKVGAEQAAKIEAANPKSDANAAVWW